MIVSTIGRRDGKKDSIDNLAEVPRTRCPFVRSSTVSSQVALWVTSAVNIMIFPNGAPFDACDSQKHRFGTWSAWKMELRGPRAFGQFQPSSSDGT